MSRDHLSLLAAFSVHSGMKSTKACGWAGMANHIWAGTLLGSLAPNLGREEGGTIS